MTLLMTFAWQMVAKIVFKCLQKFHEYIIIQSLRFYLFPGNMFLIVYRACILDWTFAGSDFIGNDLRNWYFYIYTFERFFGKRNSIIGYMICHTENIDKQCMNVIYIYNAVLCSNFLEIKIAYYKNYHVAYNSSEMIMIMETELM